ncbi:unnamed protein product [Phytophthora fragariaefolia]|uniref:Unnamed protein product n=1 Tax=Phytophthora fragariaefolia TaxID=1490495 RepID=A0A9W6YGQ4_9STRA|nr:unnamed protein product [Phytophthora fragariaefolia]
MQCNKREGDTWHDYLECLNFIESLLEGDQTKMVMEVFGNNACPELAPTLLSSVPDDATDYVMETDRMKRLLYKLRGDGRRCGMKRDERKNRQADRRNPSTQNNRSGNRQNDDHHWRNQRNNNDNSDRRPQQQNNAQAFAAMGNRGEIRCHVCRQPGHKIFTYPLEEQAKKLATRGSANVAAADDSDDDASSDSDDEGHVWVAAGDAERRTSATRANVWTVDSGATHHLCIDRDQLFAIEPAFLLARVANGDLVTTTEKGKAVITTTAKGVPHTVLLENVYYNLISVAQLTARGFTCTFGKEQCIITAKTGKIAAEVGKSPSTGLWSVGIDQGVASFAAMTSATLQQWHERLGHVNYQDLVRMIDKNLVEGMVASIRKVDFCMNCAEAKQAHRAKNKQDTSTSAPTDEPGATLCVDLKTDMTPDRLGHKHILTIVDHATNYNRVYLLRNKSDAEGHLEDFVSTTCQLERTQIMRLPLTLSGKWPSVSYILKFCSKCTSHIAHTTKRSVNKRAEKGVVIGIDLKKKAYRVLIPRTKRVISTTHIQNIDRLDSCAVGRYMDAVDTDNTDTVEEAHMQQHETNTPSDDNGDGAQTGSPAEQHQLTYRAIQHIFGLNRGARAPPRDDFRLPQSFLEKFATPASVLLTIVLKEGTAFAVLLERDGIKEPVTVDEVMSSPYWREWWQAIVEELRAILKNATWEVVDIPTDGNVISAKWVFKLKFDNKGELERFKARLVARGFTQKFGIDFTETFAPVLKIASLRSIVALASQWHAVIRQGDVPNAYLRADLDRPIYMRAPTRLQIPKGKCLLLRKSLYGLKQSGKLWNDTATY